MIGRELGYLAGGAGRALTTRASFFRVVLSPHGRRHALALMLLPQEATPPAGRTNLCITYNEPLARWLISDYVSHFGT